VTVSEPNLKNGPEESPDFDLGKGKLLQGKGIPSILVMEGRKIGGCTEIGGKRFPNPHCTNTKGELIRGGSTEKDDPRTLKEGGEMRRLPKGKFLCTRENLNGLFQNRGRQLARGRCQSINSRTLKSDLLFNARGV